jgi:hypothetical protein
LSAPKHRNVGILQGVWFEILRGANGAPLRMTWCGINAVNGKIVRLL